MSTERKLYAHEQTEAREKCIEILEAECYRYWPQIKTASPRTALDPCWLTLYITHAPWHSVTCVARDGSAVGPCRLVPPYFYGYTVTFLPVWLLRVAGDLENWCLRNCSVIVSTEEVEIMGNCLRFCWRNLFMCTEFNSLNTGLNPICNLLTLLRAHHILHVSRVRVNIWWKIRCYVSKNPF